MGQNQTSQWWAHRRARAGLALALRHRRVTVPHPPTSTTINAVYPQPIYAHHTYQLSFYQRQKHLYNPTICQMLFQLLQ